MTVSTNKGSFRLIALEVMPWSSDFIYNKFEQSSDTSHLQRSEVELLWLEMAVSSSPLPPLSSEESGKNSIAANLASSSNFPAPLTTVTASASQFPSHKGILSVISYSKIWFLHFTIFKCFYKCLLHENKHIPASMGTSLLVRSCWACRRAAMDWRRLTRRWWAVELLITLRSRAQLSIIDYKLQLHTTCDVNPDIRSRVRARRRSTFQWQHNGLQIGTHFWHHYLSSLVPSSFNISLRNLKLSLR